MSKWVVNYGYLFGEKPTDNRMTSVEHKNWRNKNKKTIDD